MKLFLLTGIFFMTWSVKWVYANSDKVECRDKKEKISAKLMALNLRYPESPTLIAGKLYFVEFARDQISVLSSSGVEKFWSKPGCGPAAVTSYLGRSFLVACYGNNTLVQIEPSEQGKGFVEKVYDRSGKLAFKGPNDFSPDANGGYYFTASGVFSTSAPIEGEIHYLSKDGEIRKVVSGIHYANGIIVAKDGKQLLVSEHLKNRILSYRILNDGGLSKKFHVFADLSKILPMSFDLSGGLQGPDGMRMGNDGIIYVAQYAGSRIIKLDRKGELVGIISIHSIYPNTTNVWVDGSKLYLSALEESKSSESQGIILMIDDPKLSSRKELSCSIASVGGA